MQQRLGLELLHLPLTDLEQRLAQELVANPVLEELVPESMPVPEDGSVKERETSDDFDADDFPVPDGEQWFDELPLPSDISDDASERKNELLFNSPAPSSSLVELLLIEVEMADIPEALRPAVIEIISSIDPDGFLRVNTADLAMSCDCDLDDIDAALKLVQEIAPPGVGARDLPECLMLQLQRRDALTPEMTLLLQTGLQDVADGRLNQLKEKLNVSAEQLDKMISLIRELDPVPGRRFSTAETTVIQPELEIEQLKDGSFAVILLRGNLRRVGISAQYSKLLDDDTLSSDDRKYISEKLLRARELIKALSMRESTLKRLGDVIVEKQQEFLKHGIAGLKSFTMREAGALLGHDESTISRAVADKYIRTPHGVMPLRFFFSSGGGSGEGGDRVASAAVMEQIRRIVQDEDPTSPCSDERIVAILGENGVKIARRTVAKYREILKIPPASGRKR